MHAWQIHTTTDLPSFAVINTILSSLLLFSILTESTSEKYDSKSETYWGQLGCNCDEMSDTMENSCDFDDNYTPNDDACKLINKYPFYPFSVVSIIILPVFLCFWNITSNDYRALANKRASPLNISLVLLGLIVSTPLSFLSLYNEQLKNLKQIEKGKDKLDMDDPAYYVVNKWLEFSQEQSKKTNKLLNETTYYLLPIGLMAIASFNIINIYSHRRLAQLRPSSNSITEVLIENPYSPTP